MTTTQWTKDYDKPARSTMHILTVGGVEKGMVVVGPREIRSVRWDLPSGTPQTETVVRGYASVDDAMVSLEALVTA